MNTLSKKTIHAQAGAAPEERVAQPDALIGSATNRAQIALTTSEATKNLLTMAAEIEGMDLTSFLLGPATERARRVVMEHTTINLSREGQLRLATLINTPQEPSEAMRELMSLPDLPLS